VDEKYFAEKIEEKWQQLWAEAGAFEAGPDGARPSFYRREMLPGSSGFLHVGHVRDYSIRDALSWYKRLRGGSLFSVDESKNLLTPGVVMNQVEGTNRWKRMSQSLDNDVDPDEMLAAYGADAVRLYILFAAPPEHELRWQEAGIEGAARFLRRVWGMLWRWSERLAAASGEESAAEATGLSDPARALRRKTHRTIACVTDDFEKLRFHNCVAALMKLSNALADFRAQPATSTDADVFAVREALEALVVMLAPFAPHIAEEMWEHLGHERGLPGGQAKWPVANEELARREELEVPVQVNGKLRSRLRAALDASDEALRAAALEDKRVRALTAGREIVRVIVARRRLVNVVVK
jgi:leucyl-tRNA synthetase